MVLSRGRQIPLQGFQQEALDRQLGKAGAHARPEPAASKQANVHTRTTGKKGPSGLEQRFMAHLDLLKAGGLVVGWAFELANVDLGLKGSWKKPDFWVQVAAEHVGAWPVLSGTSSSVVVVEVKPADGDTGKPYLAARGSLPIKAAAQRLALIGVPVYVAWPAAQAWTFGRVPTREVA